MDVFDDFAAETARLDALLVTLDEEQWAAPSACAGWSIADVVLHLAMSEEAVVASFEQGDSRMSVADPTVARAPVEGDGAVDAIMAALVDQQRGEPGSAVHQRWRAAHAASIARLRNAGPDDRIPWVAVPLPARTLATTRLSEHWIHSLDIHEPLGVDLPDTDRLWHIARLAWRTLPYAFAGEDRTAPTVALELTSPSGERWSFGDADAAVQVAGPAGEWCRLAARRLRPSQTSLTAAGAEGAAVLELVRTYA